MSVVEVLGLAKSYGSLPALRDVSFQVDEGECVAILGPNGAGKSTTIEILEGFRRRDAGFVRVLGVDPAEAGPAWRAQLGIVLQECGFESFLTVRELLDLHAGYYPAPRPVGEVLELCQLSDRASSRVLRLSGGQRRRLDVALAMVGDPAVIFLDEPTTGFDPVARRAFWTVIQELRDSGATVVLTTHVLEEAERLADRLVLIIDGAVAVAGTTREIRAGAGVCDVRFTFPLGLTDGEHEALVALCVELDARMAGPVEVGIATSEPTLVLAHLTSWAASLHLELDGIRVERPTLEDVYLGLVEGGSRPPPPPLPLHRVDPRPSADPVRPTP